MVTRVINKVKAGLQDLELGVGQSTQTRQGKNVTVDKIAGEFIVKDLAQLKGLNTDVGYAALPNGSGSLIKYEYDSANTDISDDDEVVKPNSGVGRWLKRTKGEIIKSATGTQTVQEMADSRVIKRQDVAAAVATNAGVGAVIETNTYEGSGGGNRYEVVAGGTGTADGGSFIDMDNGNQLKGLFPNGDVYVNQFGGNKSDVSVDDRAAFVAALAYSPNVLIEPGDGYYVSSPIPWPSAGSLSGPEIISRESNSAVKIYAPAGLFINMDSGRKFGTWSYFEVYGDTAPYSGTCFDGRFGGFLTGVYLRQFSKLMENDFAYLIYLRRCRFNQCDDAFKIATANAAVFDECWFGSGVVRGIDVVGTTLGTSAINTAYPLVIKGGTNFNAGTATEFLIRSRGSLLLHDSYMEAFSDIAGDALIEFVAGRFDDSFLEITGNEINAQNHANRLIKIYGDNSSGTVNASGLIAHNRLLGSVSKPILIGGQTIAGASDEVQGITVGPNSAGFGRDYVDYSSEPANLATQYFRGIYSGGGLDVSGASYVSIPLSDAADSFGVQTSSGNWLPPRAGVYEIGVSIEGFATTNARAFECRVTVNGAQIKSRVHSIIAPDANNWYATVSLSFGYPLSRNDTIQVQARNGGTISSAEVTAIRAGEYNW